MSPVILQKSGIFQPVVRDPSAYVSANCALHQQSARYSHCVRVTKSSCAVTRANEDRERPSFQEMESLGKALGSHSATRAIMV